MGLRDQLAPRRAIVPRRFVGMTYSVTPGGFSYTVPAGVDEVDIVAVGGGGSYNSANGDGGGGGALAARLGKRVTVGQGLSGVVGNGGSGGATGGATSIDGLTAGGGLTGNTQARSEATGGDVNKRGSYRPASPGTSGGCSPSLSWDGDNDATIAAAGGLRTHGGAPLYPGHTGAGGTGNATVPGGGGGSGQPGAAGGIYVFLYAYS
jgi:hypothetical protein